MVYNKDGGSKVSAKSGAMNYNNSENSEHTHTKIPITLNIS